MSATKRLDLLISNLVHQEQELPKGNEIRQERSIESLPPLTFTEPDCYSTSVLPTTILPKAVPLPPRRDASSLKHQRRRHPMDPTDKNKQPLLNSSTLDDLFQALALECEQYLAATIAAKEKEQNHEQSVRQSSKEVASNDDDYENLQTSKSSSSTATTTGSSSLKTSIEVISPVKRHVVSITVSSRVSASPVVVPTISPPINRPSQPLPTVIEPTISRSSEDDLAVQPSPSSTGGRRRRRRTRKRMISATAPRSSSSSAERQESIVEKKPTHSKRSFSTDHRSHRTKDIPDHRLQTSSSHRGTSRRTRRRDISLQHSSNFRNERSSPLSVLLTSTSKSTSDFLDQNQARPPRQQQQQQQQQQQRRSRLETVPQKPLTLLDRMHQQFYRLSPTRHQKSNIPTTHRIPSSYRVY